MAKAYKIVGSLHPGTSDIKCATMDWNLCVLCQVDTYESLSCPADSKRDKKGSGYKTTAENLLAFEKLDWLPRTISLSRLDKGEGIEASFQNHKAKWHDSCRLKFNKTELVRAEKRKVALENSSPSNVYNMFIRTSKKRVHCSAHYCFFCDTEAQAGESLYRASTLHLDVRVRHCALHLQDKALLAKLSAGDMVALDAEYHIKCLVSLYNRTREAKTCTTESDVDALNHGIAFAEQGLKKPESTIL